MKTGLIYLAFFAFAMMILQSFLTWLQFKSYQKAVASLRGNGWILGVGMRKGGFHLKGGAIVILAWDEKNDRIMACKKLEGIAIWKRFETIDAYNGMTLNEVRRRGIEEDYLLNRRARDKEPYSPLIKDKRRKKGALIQAVEALDNHLAKKLNADEVPDGGRSYGKSALQEKIAERRREIQNEQKTR